MNGRTSKRYKRMIRREAQQALQVQKHTNPSSKETFLHGCHVCRLIIEAIASGFVAVETHFFMFTVVCCIWVVVDIVALIISRGAVEG